MSHGLVNDELRMDDKQVVVGRDMRRRASGAPREADVPSLPGCQSLQQRQPAGVPTKTRGASPQPALNPTSPVLFLGILHHAVLDPVPLALASPSDRPLLLRPASPPPTGLLFRQLSLPPRLVPPVQAGIVAAGLDMGWCSRV
ncbi:hypothetical protein CDD83_7975 [Cordyceps sp. RAO-2017]|nr:hypothetical protein CDD83_7975 [Cordyceps sp. RAO-2017]